MHVGKKRYLKRNFISRALIKYIHAKLNTSSVGDEAIIGVNGRPVCFEELGDVLYLILSTWGVLVAIQLE